MNRALRAVAAALCLCGGVPSALAQELWLRQPDGKVVTVIDDKGVGGPLQQWIERRNADGSLDLAFGDRGRVAFSLSADILEPRSLSIDAQGHLILAGTAIGAADRSAAVVSRFLPDGRADPRWGTWGTSRLAPATLGAAQAVDTLAMPDRSMLLLGQVDSAGQRRVMLWRLQQDGTADTRFGSGGLLHLVPLEGALPVGLRHDEDGSVLIAAQRARAPALLLEVHRWRQGLEGVHLVARQEAPVGWRGPVTLDRRDGRWQWTDPVMGGALPLALADAPDAPSAAVAGEAAFSPFARADASATPDPPSPSEPVAAPPLGWLWLVPAAAALGIATWRLRPARAQAPRLADARVAMVDATLTQLARQAPTHAGERPTCAPPDDLQRIKGIGPLLEKRLHGEGIFHFRQIAQWRPEELADIGSRLSAFKGRVERDRWVAQAIELSR